MGLRHTQCNFGAVAQRSCVTIRIFCTSVIQEVFFLMLPMKAGETTE